MTDKRVTTNAYAIFLLQKIMVIEGKISAPFPTREKHFIEIANNISTPKKSISPITVRKFFGATQHSTGLTFNPAPINMVISGLKVEKKQSWMDFIDDFGPDPRDIDPGEFIPIAHFDQLSDNWKIKIVLAVQRTLEKIYPDRDLSYLDLQAIDNLPFRKIPPKLEKFLNTTWYAYFYFPFSDPYPQIIRTIIRIKDNPDHVETEAPIGHQKLEDFIGAVKFDKNETTLLFNLVSQSTGERAVHIKLLVHTTGTPPEIALGEYSNIGIGGIGIHSIRLVMVYLDPNKLDIEKAMPKIFDNGDSEFYEFPLALPKYLAIEKDNYRHTPPEPVLSYFDLDLLVKKMEKKKYVDKRIRLKKKFQIVLSAPRYSISDQDYKTYRKTLLEIKQFIEDELQFEVDDYYLREEKAAFHIPRQYDFYSDRIRNCEILLAFLFHKDASECISELSWAAETGRAVHIFTSPSKEFVPKAFYNNPPPHVLLHNHFSDLDTAASWFRQGAKSLFEEQLHYQNKLLKGNEKK